MAHCHVGTIHELSVWSAETKREIRESPIPVHYREQKKQKTTKGDGFNTYEQKNNYSLVVGFANFF